MRAATPGAIVDSTRNANRTILGTSFAPRASLWDSRRCLRGCDHRMDVEVDNVPPCRQPFVQQRAIGALHHLKAARQIVGDPAVHVCESLGRESSTSTKAVVDRPGISVAEMLDDHEQHGDGGNGCAVNRTLRPSADATTYLKACSLASAPAAGMLSMIHDPDSSTSSHDGRSTPARRRAAVTGRLLRGVAYAVTALCAACSAQI